MERASGFTSVRWHLSLMRVALLHGAVRTEVLSLGSSARALSGDDWWWCFNGGGFQRSAFGVYSQRFLRSLSSGVAPSVSCVVCVFGLVSQVQKWFIFSFDLFH